MKRFPIFRTGRHTASSGSTLDFSDAQLRDAVAAYDPALHEAPIVVGHPRDNHPAFGWVGGLSFDEATGEILADPKQIDADFAEMVKAGRFKKRSASWYLPEAPNNPKPGTLYLRHVGFLGAQPPAVKGLGDVAFSEEEGVVEFGDGGRWAFRSIADVLRNLREWLIADKGQETADKVLPQWDLDAVRRAADEPAEADSVQPAGMLPAFSEDDPMKIEELQARIDTLTAERDAALAKAMPADFAERETGVAQREAAVAAREQELAKAAVEARVDAAVKAGRVLPKQRAAVVDFALALDDADAVISFGEGDKAEKVARREAYLRQVEASPKVVDYREAAPAGDTPPAGAADPTAIAKKAGQLREAAEKAGQPISFTEAVAQATAELSAD